MAPHSVHKFATILSFVSNLHLPVFLMGMSTRLRLLHSFKRSVIYAMSLQSRCYESFAYVAYLTVGDFPPSRINLKRSRGDEINTNKSSSKARPYTNISDVEDVALIVFGVGSHAHSPQDTLWEYSIKPVIESCSNPSIDERVYPENKTSVALSRKRPLDGGYRENQLKLMR